MTMETDKIENDINRSRHALNDTLEALGGKLSPGQMLDEALGLMKGQAGQFAGNLGKQVKDNPVPVLLIGAGIAMLALNRHKSDETSESVHPHVTHDEWHAETRFRKLEGVRASISKAVDETQEAFSHRLHDAEAKALELKQNAGEAIEAFKERVRSAGEKLGATAHGVRERMNIGAGQAAHFVKEQAADMKHKTQAFYDEYPLAAGAIAVGIGAIIGASAPLSEIERDRLQGAADTAARASAGLAQKGANAVERTADKVVNALH